MIILRETSESQELNIIARDSRINLLTFTDEQSREVTNVVSADFIDAGYYLTADVVLDFLKEDHTYRMRAYYSATGTYLDRVLADGGTIEAMSNECFGFLNETNTEISFNGLVFVTNQDVVDNAGIYDVNDGEYKSNDTNNEYIILD